MSEVDRNELKKVPYINYIPSDGRIVFLQPYLDKADNKFKTFVPQGKKLTWIFAEPVESCYYAESVIDETNDIYLRLIDIIARYYSFDSVIHTMLGIIRDIENCGIVVEKYFIFLDLYRNTKDVLTSNLITTDLEHFFGNVRSIYDLLQSLIRDLWRRTSRKKLPDNFSRMVKLGTERLRNRYDIPEMLIKYYMDTKDFFDKCREIRNSIYHRGLNIQIVFCTEDGFAFQRSTPLLPNPITSRFDIWPEKKTKENELVSVLALISYINKRVLEDTDAFSQVIMQSIKPPRPVSETHKVFFRGPYVHHLLRSGEYLEKQWIEKE